MIKATELTPAQTVLLNELDDERYKFLGKKERTGEVLVRCGFAETDLRVKSRDYATGLVHVTRAFRRTAAGKAFAESASK